MNTLRSRACALLAALFVLSASASILGQVLSRLPRLADCSGRRAYESVAAGYAAMRYGIPPCQVADFVCDGPEPTRQHNRYVAMSAMAPRLVDVFGISTATNRYVVARFYSQDAYERYSRENAVEPLLYGEGGYFLLRKR